MTRFDTVLFDLDGTLIDHFAAIQRSHAHTMRALGLPDPTIAQVRAAVGGGLELALRRLAGEARAEEALAVFRSHWDATMLDDVILLPGAEELLRALHNRGTTLAVLTNKLGASSRRICEHLGIAPLLAGVFGASDTAWLKPQPELTRHVLTTLKAPAAGTLLVGDSPFDIETGRLGGFPCWCVTTGTHTAEELAAAHAERVFADLRALQGALVA